MFQYFFFVSHKPILFYHTQEHKLVEVQTYNREEGHLTRFWYPVHVLEKPSSGLARSSSFLAIQAHDTIQFDAQQELFITERQLTRLNCRNALKESMRTRSGNLNTLIKIEILTLLFLRIRETSPQA